MFTWRKALWCYRQSTSQRGRIRKVHLLPEKRTIPCQVRAIVMEKGDRVIILGRVQIRMVNRETWPTGEVQIQLFPMATVTAIRSRLPGSRFRKMGSSVPLWQVHRLEINTLSWRTCGQEEWLTRSICT